MNELLYKKGCKLYLIRDAYVISVLSQNIKIVTNNIYNSSLRGIVKYR